MDPIWVTLSSATTYITVGRIVGDFVVFDMNKLEHTLYFKKVYLFYVNSDLKIAKNLFSSIQQSQFQLSIQLPNQGPDLGSGSGMNTYFGSYFQKLRNNFLGLKIHKFFDTDADPEIF
jgi:hypothetical protein